MHEMHLSQGDVARVGQAALPPGPPVHARSEMERLGAVLSAGFIAAQGSILRVRDAPPPRGGMAHGGLLPAEAAAICGACVRLALELLGLGTGMRMGLGEGDDAGVCRGPGKEGACRRCAAGSVGGDGTSVCLP